MTNPLYAFTVTHTCLLREPRLIVADEPVSMLDASVRVEILKLMHSLQEAHGLSVIYIRVRKLLTSLTNHRVRHCEGVLPEAISALSGGDCFVGKCALLAMTKTRELILLQTLMASLSQVCFWV
jgi:ABC-type uncharacterized transport system ATPase subunit